MAFAELKQALPISLHTIGVNAVGVRIDEVDGDPQVWLSQEIMFMLFFQRSCFVLDKPEWEHMPMMVS